MKLKNSVQSSLKKPLIVLMVIMYPRIESMS